MRRHEAPKPPKRWWMVVACQDRVHHFWLWPAFGHISEKQLLVAFPNLYSHFHHKWIAKCHFLNDYGSELIWEPANESAVLWAIVRRPEAPKISTWCWLMLQTVWDTPTWTFVCIQASHKHSETCFGGSLEVRNLLLWGEMAQFRYFWMLSRGAHGGLTESG